MIMNELKLELLAGSWWQQQTDRCCCVCTHQIAALFSVKWRHGRSLESVMSNWKSSTIRRCVFTWRI